MVALSRYLEALHGVTTKVEVTDELHKPVNTNSAIDQIIDLLHQVRDKEKKNIFIGNGGSAAIASHMAIDYSKNGRLPSLALNDGSALTCLSNDLGFENVFAEQIRLHAKQGDLLFAISSSGASANILTAVKQAKESGCRVITLSGFSVDNPLREQGTLNWYVKSSEYGFVEISHLVICHAILDLEMGWQSGT
jgi:D-sedoheptulose 7-phosphate isomerase